MTDPKELPATHPKPESIICSICLEDVSMRSKAITPCVHQFCRDCLMTWLSTNSSCPTCPTCRYLILDASRELLIVERVKHLLIFAMRGTLIDRTHSKPKQFKERQGIKIGTWFIVPRPGLRELMSYSFQNFDVAIWTSAEAQNTPPVLVDRYICGPENRKTVFVWSREGMQKDLNGQDRNATLKDLQHVWNFYPQYSESNTVLIDDTVTKARLQPDNHLQINEWKSNQSDDESLIRLMNYLDILLKVDDVRPVLRTNPFLKV